MNPPWPWIWAGLRRYLVPGLILGTLLTQVLGYLLLGDGPMPQIPPDGHQSVQSRIRVRWDEGGLEPPFTVQVIEADGSFEAPVHERTIKSRWCAHWLPILEPNTEYRWRVVHEATGEVSPEASFTTARYRIPY